MTASRLAAAAVLIPALAHADPGHWAEAGGHTHWLALGALALAGAIGLVALLRVRARREVQDGREPQEGAAEAGPRE